MCWSRNFACDRVVQRNAFAEFNKTAGFNDIWAVSHQGEYIVMMVKFKRAMLYNLCWGIACGKVGRRVIVVVLQ